MRAKRLEKNWTKFGFRLKSMSFIFCLLVVCGITLSVDLVIPANYFVYHFGADVISIRVSISSASHLV